MQCTISDGTGRKAAMYNITTQNEKERKKDMDKNKFMTAIMAGAMMVGSALPVFAEEAEQTVGQTEADTGATRETEVLYSQASAYTVIIPKTIILDGETKDADYAVNVKGDISSDKQVQVAPETSFQMKDQAAASIKKTDVDAAVVQDETVRSSAEVCAAETGTTKNGNVSAPGITAGSWKGTFTFHIELQDAE